VTFDNQRYFTGVRKVLSELQAAGYEIPFDPKNFWKRSRYKGINATVRSADGQQFELQFHTAGTEGSWLAKQASHGNYEQWRKARGEIQQRRLEQLMREQWKPVRIPPRALEIGRVYPEN
jgi:hypothetical protein